MQGRTEARQKVEVNPESIRIAKMQAQAGKSSKT